MTNDKKTGIDAGRLEEFYKNSSAYQDRMAKKDTPEWRRVFEGYAAQVAAYCGEGAEVLDLGCGGGWSCVALKRLRPDLKITGLDLSAESFEKGAKGVFKDIEFRQGSATSLPFRDASFDVVASYAMMEHIPEAERALNEMSRVIRRRGVLIVCGPNMLSPLRGLKLFFKRLKDARAHPDGRLMAILRAFSLLLRKKLSNRLVFDYREPVLDMKGFRGSDWDAVYLLNPFDLVKFAGLNGMEVLSRAGASSRAGKAVLRVFPAIAGGVYFAARKR